MIQNVGNLRGGQLMLLVQFACKLNNCSPPFARHVFCLLPCFVPDSGCVCLRETERLATGTGRLSDTYIVLLYRKAFLQVINVNSKDMICRPRASKGKRHFSSYRIFRCLIWYLREVEIYTSMSPNSL